MTTSNTSTTANPSDYTRLLYAPGTSHFKTKHTVTTTTTRIQAQTEDECAPFFISIPSLDAASRRDLVRLGMLRSPHDDDNDDDNDNEEDPSKFHILLLKHKHATYLRRPLYRKDVQMLPSSYIALDSSKPWILYWTLHALDLLDQLPDEETMVHMVQTLESCWTNVPVKKGLGEGDEGSGSGGGGGGFGGGNGQLPHCATTYAAVNALSILAGCDAEAYPKSTTMALELLKRKRHALHTWYLTLQYDRTSTTSSGGGHGGDGDGGDGDGDEPRICGYRMHHDGEVDVRATYCICAVCSLLNILTDDLTDGMMAHIVDCQSYEGGFGGEPFAEAHGGYTFCALGALQILTKTKTRARGGKTRMMLEESGVDRVALRDWLVNRQLGYEGGFQGRCNKLVDGCYTFWVGGALAILGLGEEEDGASSSSGKRGEFDSGVYVHAKETTTTQDDGNQTTTTHHGVVERILDEATLSIMDNHEDGGLLFDQKLLQRYVLLCAQDINGGLRDKPSKGRDFYHSCYNLSGLSVSQHVQSTRLDGKPVMYEEEGANVLGVTHPVYNIRLERLKFMMEAFHGKDGSG